MLRGNLPGVEIIYRPKASVSCLLNKTYGHGVIAFHFTEEIYRKANKARFGRPPLNGRNIRNSKSDDRHLGGFKEPNDLFRISIRRTPYVCFGTTKALQNCVSWGTLTLSFYVRGLVRCPVQKVGCDLQGLGQSVKKQWDSVVLNTKNKFNVVAIQETKNLSEENLFGNILTNIIDTWDGNAFCRRYNESSGKWDRANILPISSYAQMLLFALGLQINILKSKLMGIIGVFNEEILAAAKHLLGVPTLFPLRFLSWCHVGMFGFSYLLELILKVSSILCPAIRNPRGGVEEEQLHHLVELVGSISLSPSNDRWAWLLGSSGQVFCHSAKKHLLMIFFYLRFGDVY
ncbi:hypothetical protein Tco_0015939 [Tanacetum coccineum]